jgi:hypothetical protein
MILRNILKMAAVLGAALTLSGPLLTASPAAAQQTRHQATAPGGPTLSSNGSMRTQPLSRTNPTLRYGRNHGRYGMRYDRHWRHHHRYGGRHWNRHYGSRHAYGHRGYATRRGGPTLSSRGSMRTGSIYRNNPTLR